MRDDLLIQPEMFEFEPLGSGTPGVQFEGANPIDVRWVQNSLNRILGLRLPIDGVAGPATRSATRAFQKKQGLKADGVAGPATTAAMIAAGAPSPPKALSRAFSPAFSLPPVREVRCPSPGAAPDAVLDNFGFDKSSLVAVKHEPQLAALARAVISSKRTQRPVESILIAGHTDRVGSDDYNLQLARRRAREVQSELARTLERMSPGVTSRIRFEIASCGEREPKATPGASRRAEIFLRTSVPRLRGRRSSGQDAGRLSYPQRCLQTPSFGPETRCAA